MITAEKSRHRRIFVPSLLILFALAPVSSLSGAQEPKPSEHTPRVRDYDYRDMPLDTLIKTLAEPECLAVVFDRSVDAAVQNAPVDLKMKNASPMRAIQTVLKSQQLNHEYDGPGTLIVYRGESRPGRVKLTDVVMRSTPLTTFVDQIAQYQSCRAILLDSAGTLKHVKVNLELRGVSTQHALEVGLAAHGLTYHHADCFTLVIYQDRAVTSW